MLNARKEPISGWSKLNKLSSCMETFHMDCHRARVKNEKIRDVIINNCVLISIGALRGAKGVLPPPPL